MKHTDQRLKCPIFPHFDGTGSTMAKAVVVRGLCAETQMSIFSGNCLFPSTIEIVNNNNVGCWFFFSRCAHWYIVQLPMPHTHALPTTCGQASAIIVHKQHRKRTHSVVVKATQVWLGIYLTNKNIFLLPQTFSLFTCFCFTLVYSAFECVFHSWLSFIMKWLSSGSSFGSQFYLFIWFRFVLLCFVLCVDCALYRICTCG